MIKIIELPQVGESVTEGVIGKWLVEPGQRVEKYAPLVEVVTDKVSMEAPSPYTGVFVRALADEGETVPMGQPICEMDVDGEGPSAAAPTDEAAGDGDEAVTEDETAEEDPGRVGGAWAMPAAHSPDAAESGQGEEGAQPAFEFMDSVRSVGPTGSGERGEGRPDALQEETIAEHAHEIAHEDAAPSVAGPDRSHVISPLVARLSAQYGIDLSTLQGTGTGGRITSKDLLEAVNRLTARAQEESAEEEAAPEEPAEAQVETAAVEEDAAEGASGEEAAEAAEEIAEGEPVAEGVSAGVETGEAETEPGEAREEEEPAEAIAQEEPVAEEEADEEEAAEAAEEIAEGEPVAEGVSAGVETGEAETEPGEAREEEEPAEAIAQEEPVAEEEADEEEAAEAAEGIAEELVAEGVSAGVETGEAEIAAGEAREEEAPPEAIAEEEPVAEGVSAGVETGEAEIAAGEAREEEAPPEAIAQEEPVADEEAGEEEALEGETEEVMAEEEPVADEAGEEEEEIAEEASAEAVSAEEPASEEVAAEEEEEAEEAAAETTPGAVVAETSELPLTPIRRIIAEHMARSAREIPAAWAMVETDVTRLVRARDALRAAFEEQHGVPLTYLPFAASAVAAALREHSRLNARWDDGHITLNNRVNIAVAVATEAGLMVPVVRDVDALSIAAIAAELRRLSEGARAGTLGLEDVQGGTFTLNNTGALGSVVSVPIINHPQAAILTTEAIVKRPVVVEGDAIAVRSMMNLCLTFDHRVCDGAEAAAFLSAVKARLEVIDESIGLG